MKIALVQLNCTLGDLAGNSAKILDYAQRAKAQGATLLLTPELSLCGYPPEDLLLRAGFYRACNEALQHLAQRVEHGMTLVVGHPHAVQGVYYNAASVLCDGAIVTTYYKHALPNHSVFDEQRYFNAGDAACVFEHGGVRFGLNICADIWQENAAQRAAESGAEVLLVLNASPYHLGKHALRQEMIRARIAETDLAVVYANLVGGQDELVFDGASFAMDNRGALTHQLAAFEEGLALIEIDSTGLHKGDCASVPQDEASVYAALCLGLRDYIQKNRFSGVLLGLSGGIDSALTLAIAVDALGADKVHAVMMPSPYTAQISLDDAREMAHIVGVRYDELNIQDTVDALCHTLSPLFKDLPADTTEENLQARTRGTLLMALSNKTGALVLTTGNKSEMAVGYCTLYGDMAGGFAPLKDVSKLWVYRLSNYRNGLGRVIPERIITRPPSAELKPNQTDQDNLPSYEVLDALMAGYVEQNLSIDEIIALGYAEADVLRVVKLIRLSEYKRRQSPIGVRVTARSFGKDWRYPVTVRYQDNF
jgi:NAD+ synthase (glutamine-hydrolysing)